MNEKFILFFGLMLTVIPIIREWRQKKNKIYISVIFICAIGLGYFSWSKIDFDSYRDKVNGDKIDSLNVSIQNLKGKLTDAGNQWKEFTDHLKHEFGIIRDSTTNQPKIFKTYIQKADVVHIGN